jgi:hypothetical protein
MAKTKTSPEPEQEDTVPQNVLTDAQVAPEPVGFNSARYANVLQGQLVCWFQDADSSRDAFNAMPIANNGQGILTLDVKVQGNNWNRRTGVRHIHDPELAAQSNDARRNSGGWCTWQELIALTQAKRDAQWLRAEEEREAQIAARELDRQRRLREKAEFESHLATMAKG